ncbi:MAG: peptidyl-prolyl cis-trans isomerase (rotamase) - cyclophilin family, partial [Actinobacteria bacterium]|nr:peptidyl-prolyl cis-trans isomerase (rotamase) - cyclophilin family [Actinomycetota bacterium]
AVTGTAAACSTTKPARGGTVSQSTPPPMTVSPSKTYTATIVTSCGTVVVALDAKDSPNTVNSFAYLASKGFYDGLTFHRVAKDFAVQGGDPAGTGSGGPGYSVQDNVPAGVTYTMGTVAMAKTGSEPPGTAGSQFFIVPTAGASRGYTPDYAILGHVTSGQDAVTKMNALAPASGDGPPVQPIYIEKITVTSS